MLYLLANCDGAALAAYRIYATYYGRVDRIAFYVSARAAVTFPPSQKSEFMSFYLTLHAEKLPIKLMRSNETSLVC